MSQEPSLQLDHVCLAVRNLDRAARQLERVLGYSARTDPVENPTQQVIVQFMRKSGSIDIKLIQPSSAASPLVEFIQRSGGGLHHLAFRTDSVRDATRELSDRGGRVLSPPEPGAAFNDALIAFVSVGAGLNIELVDTDERARERVTRDQA